MYSTSDIAELLGTDRRNVNYYIRQGHLKANMSNDGYYEITQPDYFSFRKEYYDTDKRNSNRGIAKKLSDRQVIMMSVAMKDMLNDNISLAKFKARYKNKTELIPNIEDFIIYKRDRCIKYDNKNKGYRYKKLSELYDLEEITIRGIVNQTKERSDF